MAPLRAMAIPPEDSAVVEETPSDERAPDGESGADKSKPEASPRPVAKPVAKAKPRTAQPPAAAPEQIEAPKIDLDDQAEPSSRGFLAESPSWLTSLAVHLAAIILLATWFFPPLPELATALLLAEPSENEIEDFEEMPEVILDPVEIEEEVELEIQPETDTIADTVSFSEFNDALAAPSFTSLSELALTPAPPSLPTDIPGFDGTGTTGRGMMARTALVRKHGGSRASEEAVADALNWLAAHQNPDGSWSLVHNVGECNGRCDHPSSLIEKPNGFTDSLRSGTGLALLPFLGAGQTHKQGRHRKTVAKGLGWLVANGKAEERYAGLSWRDSGNMYAHGLAAIALTEAYGMTRDKSLRGPAQAAVDYIVAAQDREGGGWRYRPGQAGDTSVTGWQIMALKSAYLADLSVPPAVVKQASAFLDTVQHDAGARYSYVELNAEGEKQPPRSTITAVGLLCRMYMGWKDDNPMLLKGVAELSKSGPSKNNFYYNYYAAQVLFQQTGGRGRVWREWNRDMRDQLVSQQTRTGHAKGSWFVEGAHNDRGGRIYMTSLATMCLEVYYRYMPIYQAEAVTSEFPQ